MNQPKSYLKWLLIILGIVILAALGVYFFYVKGGNVGGVLSLSSPTPTKSAVTSPSPGAGTTKTSTPASGTTTSGGQTSPASSPESPPAGWKKVTNNAVGAGPAYVEFSVYVKNDWTMYNENDTAHGPVFYTTNSNCTAGTLGTGYQNCWDHLAVSYPPMTDYSGASNLTIRSFPYSASDGNTYNAYVGINKSISDSDQKIIFDSFKIISTN